MRRRRMSKGLRIRRPRVVMTLAPRRSLRWPIRGAKKEGMVRTRKMRDTWEEL